MKRVALFAIGLLFAAHAASAVTCGGFSVVPADHVVVKFSAPLALGATHSTPIVAFNGSAINVSRNVSGGSSTDVACIDDTIDLGALGGGRYDLTWSDTTGFMTQHAMLTFAIGASASGKVDDMAVVAPAVPDQPVQFEVESCSPVPPVAYVLGNDVRVMEYEPSTLSCYSPDGTSLSKRYLLNLGLLAPGVYNVTTTREPQSSAARVRSFAFIVQQPAPSSACNGSFSITRNANGTARLHYEDPYLGYFPDFGPPSVTEIATVAYLYSDFSFPVITVVQPVRDTLDSRTPGAPTPSLICHAEDLDLGFLINPNGYYAVIWSDQLSVHGAGFSPFSQSSTTFWWSSTALQCSSFGQLFTPPALEGIPFNVTLRSVYIGSPIAEQISVTGHVVTVDEVLHPYDGPLPDRPSGCSTYTTTMSPLPAGDYTLIWRGHGGRDSSALSRPPDLVFSSKFTVIKPPRQRAARH